MSEHISSDAVAVEMQEFVASLRNNGIYDFVVFRERAKDITFLQPVIRQFYFLMNTPSVKWSFRPSELAELHRCLKQATQCVPELKRQLKL